MTPYGVIYKITNIQNGKTYIGQTTRRNPNTRWTQHKSDLNTKRCHNRKLLRAWLKYGPDCWTFCVIDTATNQSELDALELVWTDREQSTTTGYNIRSGGKGKGITADSTKRLMSASAKQRYENADARMECGNNKRGVQKTVEHRQKLSDALTGRTIPSDIVQKVTTANQKTWAARTTEEKAAVLAYSHTKLRELHAERNKNRLPSLVDPNGKVWKIESTIREFCETHRLSRFKLYGIFKETWRHHRGWRVAQSEIVG